MKIYSVGPIDLNDYELGYLDREAFEWIAYWYDLDGYDGDGEIVAFGKNGELHFGTLGHCSCYGPLDGWEQVHLESGVKPQEFLSRQDSVHGYCENDDLGAEVTRLLS